MASKRNGNISCCVTICKNTYGNSGEDVKFYCLPVAAHRKLQREKWIHWIKEMNGSDWEPSKYSRICSFHFIGNKMSSIMTSPSFIPSITSRTTDDALRKQSISLERFNRYMSRRKSSSSGPSVAERQDEIIVPEIIDDDNSIHMETLQKIDQEIQVCILDSGFDNPFGDHGVFQCDKYVFNNICHAQTQVNLPEPPKKAVYTVNKRKVDKGRGNSIIYVDKAVGFDEPYTTLQCIDGFHGFVSITKKQHILSLCGVTFVTFNILLKMLPKVSHIKINNANRLVIFLLKLKTGLTFSAIAVLFNVHTSTVSRIFIYVLKILGIACAKFIYWPDRQTIDDTMPEDFKKRYSNCRVLIDCTEIHIEQPQTVENKVKMYSHYKKGYTTKVLIGCTPGGAVSFVSPCYNERISDCQITIKSGLLDLLEPGDLILADKGFPGVQAVLNEESKKVLVVMPPFLHNSEFSKEEVETTYEIAKLRIHIERIIQRFRIYKILDKFPAEMLSHASDILFMCGVLVNLQPPIIKTGDAMNDAED